MNLDMESVWRREGAEAIKALPPEYQNAETHLTSGPAGVIAAHPMLPPLRFDAEKNTWEKLNVSKTEDRR